MSYIADDRVQQNHLLVNNQHAFSNTHLYIIVVCLVLPVLGLIKYKLKSSECIIELHLQMNMKSK